MSEPITNLEDAVRGLGALPMPMGPEPLALTEAQIEALAAAGNRVVNNEVHEHLCMCSAWPERCVSTGNYFMGAWDVDGLESALPAVLALWEQMRGGEIATLRARVVELEAERHTTNEAPDDAAKELRVRGADASTTDTLPAWLHWRFGKHGQRWDYLDVDDQSYWERHAEAVRRAVARNGFKPGGNDAVLALGTADADRSADKLTALLAPTQALRSEGEHYSATHHTYRVGRDLPETGGAPC